MASLLIQTAYLGDLLLAIPLMKGLRRLTGQPVELVCRQGFGEFIQSLNVVDQVHEVDKKNRQSFRQLVDQLRPREFDFVVSPHESLRTAFLVSRLNAKKKIGFKTWWNGFAFDERVERPMHLPDALRQLSLLGAIDKTTAHNLNEVATRFQNRAPLFGTNDLISIPEWASMELSPKRSPDQKTKTVVLAPGSQWATKRWTPEGFIEVGAWFQKQGEQIILVGSRAENEICEKISRAIPGATNMCGKTSLTELNQILTRADLLIGNDSGVMHMGSLAGTPTVAIFGPTTLDLGYRPWQNRALVVESEERCRPCGKHGHQKCPIGTHACMKNISTAQVLETVQALINTKSL